MANKFRGFCFLFLVLIPTMVILGCGDAGPPPSSSLPPPPVGKIDPGPPTALRPVNK